MYNSITLVQMPMLLVDVRPQFVFADGKRTDEIAGYVYSVVLPALGFDKLSVKIAGAQLMDAPTKGEMIPVIFDDLRVRPYVDNSGKTPRIAYSTVATGVKAANTKA